jgi:hypothetical protein
LCPAIDNPASFEISAVIRFLHAKNMSAAEIHRELCEICGRNVMSEGTIGQRCGMLRDRRTDVHDEERSDDLNLVQSVHEK